MRWLRYRFYCEEKTDDDVEPPPLKDQVVGDVVRQLEAKAQFEGEEHAVNIRVAEIDGKVYVDLCDATWRVVEVSAAGWKGRTIHPSSSFALKAWRRYRFPLVVETRAFCGVYST